MKTNQKGFGAVEIIIIIVVIALIGGVGFAVLHRNKTTPAKATSATKAEDTGANTNTNVTGDTQYLTIKEWGVKFALTADTADAYYDAKTNSSLSSMSLRSHALDSEAACKNEPLSVAGIFRVAKDAEDTTIPGKKYSETQEGKTIGDYFYFIQGAQTQCATSTDAKITLQGILNGFNTAGPSIQKV